MNKFTNGRGTKGKRENTLKNMSKAREFVAPPPPAVYKSRITSAEAEASKAGNAMIKISGEILEPEQYAGATFFDNILTDGEAKGAGFGKKKLRGLGYDVDSEVEIPDETICQQITGVETYIDFGNKQRMAKNPATDKYDVPVFETVNGKQVPVMQLEVRAYLGSVNTAPAATTPAAPSTETAPAPATVAPTTTTTPVTPAATQPAPDKAIPPWQAAKAKAAAATAGK